jgi:hypothetical protein
METTASTDRRGGRVREWFARYAPAEAGAVLGAVLATVVAEPFGAAVATAYAGSVGDGVGFYGVMLVRDLRRQPKGAPGRLARTLRGLVVEFGPAELLDSFVVRPLAMYLAATWLGHAAAGAVAGKVAADAVFYAVAIMGYELRKHLAGRNHHVQARGTARVASVSWPGPTVTPPTEVLTVVRPAA